MHKWGIDSVIVSNQRDQFCHFCNLRSLENIHRDSDQSDSPVCRHHHVAPRSNQKHQRGSSRSTSDHVTTKSADHLSAQSGDDRHRRISTCSGYSTDGGVAMASGGRFHHRVSGMPSGKNIAISHGVYLSYKIPTSRVVGKLAASLC